MARAILLHLQSDQTELLLLVVAAAAAVALFAVSLCTSGKHGKVWRQQRGSSPLPQLKTEEAGGGASRKQLLATLSGIGGKAAALAKMVSWNRRSARPGCSSDEEEEAAAAALEVEEEALWRKTIIMGDKCRPLQFSGHIAYDSDGNQLPATTINKGSAADDANNI
ncbi:hypothetical protein E2562_012678 [Oryza meyeriana var. granulata]|uniref:Uncharacterized protein n=1 Tax=Oryza meyeriana var. granulata TaxID=110450 RepID=A0A6G1CFP8_9ORYZ|nr:hypothetical protein E2562_012678 [Oryza meyeriana var. granulata]